MEIRFEYYMDFLGQPQWISGDHYARNSLFGIDDEEFVLAPIYQNWSQALLAILGVSQIDGILPISKPRGLPQNCNSLTIDSISQEGAQPRQYSWQTLDDLLNYAPEKLPILKRQGYVHKAELENVRQGKEPQIFWNEVHEQLKTNFEWTEWEYEDHTIDELIRAIITRACQTYFYESDKDIISKGKTLRIIYWHE